MTLNPFDDAPDRLKAKLATIYAVLIVANAACWGWAAWAFAGRPALMATAFLAYTLGLRHAFDADHIAAIDNVVRKLRQDGKAPVSSGLFFSLGHSSIVLVASIGIAALASAFNGPLAAFHTLGGVFGTAVSAGFLLLIGLANLAMLVPLWTSFRAPATPPGTEIDAMLAETGFLARLFRPLFRLVGRSWQLYPIGFLFGLGFDTATEIGVLGISAAEAAHSLPVWSILVFPALFAAAMSLMDFTDSALMTGAYGWAFLTPRRKLGYNLAMTALSVAVALVIGSAEALSLVGAHLAGKSAFWHSLAGANEALGNGGVVIAVIFIATWMASMLIWRWKAS